MPTSIQRPFQVAMLAELSSTVLDGAVIGLLTDDALVQNSSLTKDDVNEVDGPSWYERFTAVPYEVSKEGSGLKITYESVNWDYTGSDEPVTVTALAMYAGVSQIQLAAIQPLAEPVTMGTELDSVSDQFVIYLPDVSGL